MMQQKDDMRARTFALDGLPARKGTRPKTMVGPLHLQCSGHGDPKYLKQLVKEVFSWPDIDPAPSSLNPPDTICFRLKEIAIGSDPAAFISAREFARVILSAPTIVLALPQQSAHWAIVRGWAEPHYLRSFGFMPAGAIILYTPKNPEELEVCHLLFFESYRFASKSLSPEGVEAGPGNPELD
ncbi:MAG TPA: hypothetical protein VE242_00910 [Chthoniobacterales bacterium]|nr:hypothetical protein [Chthoniobacterales bacterium]